LIINAQHEGKTAGAHPAINAVAIIIFNMPHCGSVIKKLNTRLSTVGFDDDILLLLFSLCALSELQ